MQRPTHDVLVADTHESSQLQTCHHRKARAPRHGVRTRAPQEFDTDTLKRKKETEKKLYTCFTLSATYWRNIDYQSDTHVSGEAGERHSLLRIFEGL